MLRRHDGHGEPRHGRLRPPGPQDRKVIEQDLDRVFDLFPRLKERSNQAAGYDVRRRAADARDGPGADGQAQAAAARRAVDGPGAQADPADLRHHHRDQQPGHDGAARRAERRPGAQARRTAPTSSRPARSSARAPARSSPTTPRSRRPTSAATSSPGAFPTARGLAPSTAQRRATTSWVSRGATTRAGSRSPDRHSRIRSSRSAMPTSISPPVAVRAAMCASGST